MFTVWVTYGAFYLCRVNIGPARVEIEHAFAIDTLQMGLVLGSLKIGYAIGQLVNGQLAERFGAKRILLVGMIGSVAACVLFANAAWLATALGPILPGLAHVVSAATSLLPTTSNVTPVAALLTVLWFANGYFQAGGWPPSVKIMSNWFAPRERGRLMGILGTSYQIGSAFTILAAGALITIFHDDFRAAFLVPACLLLVAAVHAALRLRERPEDDAAATHERAPASHVTRLSVAQTLRITFTNSKIWVLALALFGLDIVRYGFLDWAPGHLKLVHGSGGLVAALKVAVFPLAGALGALVSGWATDRWFGSRRAPMIAIALGAVGVLTLAYAPLASLGAAPTVVCLGAIGFFLYGAQILLVGTAAQDFAKHGTTAAAAGFVDFMGYMGAFGGDLVTGLLLKRHDYDAAIRFWAAAAIVAALLTSTLWKAEVVQREA